MKITKIRKLSIWIFYTPNSNQFMLFISQNPEILEGTIFTVDPIGRSGFSIPYLDGSLSISRHQELFLNI